MSTDVLYTFLITISLLSIFRSEIVGFVFMDKLKKRFERSSNLYVLLLLDGINCDRCCGFWINLLVSLFFSPFLFLVSYGILIIYLSIMDAVKAET